MGTISFIRGSSQPRDRTQVSHIAGSFFTLYQPQGSPGTLEWVNLPLLQWIFLTQESNPGLLHCKWILYQLSHQGSPYYVYIHIPLNISVCTYCIFFIQSSVDGHLGYFHVLATINSAALNTGARVPFQIGIFIFSGYKSRSGITRSYGRQLLLLVF